MYDERPAFVEIQESGGGSAFQSYYAPDTIDEFFEIDGLFQVLAKSLVFIHNRKDSSDWLVKAARKVAGNDYDFRFFQTHMIELPQILEEISRPSSGTAEICVVDITSVSESLGTFCETLAGLKELTRGVWVRGYVRDINPSLIQLFDFLFLFDMSDLEFSILRSTISLSSEQIAQMRDYSSRASNVDVVLVFVNYGHIKGMPVIAYNPVTLLQIRGYKGLMDIKPFVPVIVEATKFVFNEVSKWIGDVRQRAAQASVRPIGSTLPVTREEFMTIESDPDSIVSLLNQATTQADVDEIRNLLGQLRTRRSLFLELESQEVTAAGPEAAKLRVQMQNVARDIIGTTERLENALSRVYRQR